MKQLLYFDDVINANGSHYGKEIVWDAQEGGMVDDRA